MSQFISIAYVSIILFLFTNVPVFSQGNGSSGPLTVTTGTTTIDNTATGVTGANPISTTINVSSTTGFVAGDAVLVMQMLGTGAGSYDRLVISSVTGTSMTFTTSTTVAYSSVSTDRAQVIKIPQYTSVSLSAGATLTAPAWNGTTGGVFIFYSNTTATLDGTITMNTAGFSGGTGGAAGAGGSPPPGIGGIGGSMPGATGGAPMFNPIVPSTGGMGAPGAGKGGTGGSALVTGLINGGTLGAGVSVGANPSSGMNTLIMGGGGSGGVGGQGGGPGGAGGGGGAASSVSGISGTGLFGMNGFAGNAATGVGGAGGKGGGIILLYTNSFGGSGTFTANGSNGADATGIGGKGGNGGSGGQGGYYNSGSPVNGGGGGGSGQGGKGGAGPYGGNGGAAGVIVVNESSSSWSGTMTSSPGTGGAPGAGGAAGSAGIAGNGAAGTNGGSTGSFGFPPMPNIGGMNGFSGATGGASQAPLIIGPAPVELLNFSGVISSTKIILLWTTIAEKNNLMFTIEKSINGENFAELDSIKGAVNSSSVLSYEIDDDHPSLGNNYYRLKQKDIDGTVSIFNSITIFYSEEKNIVTIFPNPTGEDKTVSIAGNEIASQLAGVSLYNNVQELVWEKENITMNGNLYTVQLPSSLPPGMYYVAIHTLSGSFKYKLSVK